MDEQKQKQNYTVAPVKTGESLAAREVESINGFYKKVVLEKTEETPYGLTELGRKVFNDRYSLKDSAGNPLELAPEEMWRRVARTIAAVEKPDAQKEWEDKFYWALQGFKFVPAGRILTGAGAKTDVTFYNCYVLPYPEDSRGGIMESVTTMMEIMARGGGVGVNLSSLRPRGAYVKGVNGRASGAVSFGALYSFVTGLIEQGGSRRGALMLMINDDHPDVEEFITVKRQMGQITNANLSVCVSDRFMDAVARDADWDLKWDGKVFKTVRAAKLWDLITESAHASGEPGCVFMERCNKESNTWYFEDIISVNPCGEQPLPAWGVCNLGAINLVPFARDDNTVDWEALGKAVRIAMRFADNVVDATPYAYEENRRAQMNVRRTGLGTMGLGDFLIKLKVRYGSGEALALAEQVYRFIRDESYRASVEIAREKGSFPDFDKEKYLQGVYIQRLPEDIRTSIEQYGIRNGVLQTQAPTGTTSLLAGVSSGIEPVYDFSFKRKDRIGEHIVYHQMYKEYLEQHPGEPVPDYFVNAKQLTPLEHVTMQAVIQKYTDASISKTVNAPENHTHEDVKELYLKAYELGCKGVTYFRENSRDVSVLESLDASAKKQEQAHTEAATPHREPKARPEVVSGKTYKVKTAYGSLYVTVNEGEDGAPFEVFAQIGKAGGFFNAKSEAVCRLASLALRSGIAAEAVITQLKGIRGPMPSFGTNGDKILSLPDAIAKVLERHIRGEQTQLALHHGAAAHGTHAASTSMADHGHAPECPQCGGVLEMGEGCQLCRSCGYSKC
ncbi:MAG: adenosylcobalamin-dependent ribonucleoside-diphosphate reductase [Parcubacteria group bacterium]|nr:adenosylcobalamin-dependent ribonucleoside-diphosphate reductase [Parcubacteria group bacterium]